MAHVQGPPELPTVTDEAGPTPLWVPILGLCLLGITGLWIAVVQATGDEQPTAEVEALADAVERAGEGAQEPAAPVPAPAPHGHEGHGHEGHDHPH